MFQHSICPCWKSMLIEFKTKCNFVFPIISSDTDEYITFGIWLIISSLFTFYVYYLSIVIKKYQRFSQLVHFLSFIQTLGHVLVMFLVMTSNGAVIIVTLLTQMLIILYFNLRVKNCPPSCCPKDPLTQKCLCPKE